MLGAILGFRPNHMEDHAAYIGDWLALLQDEPRAFLSAAAKAQAAVDWLIAKTGEAHQQQCVNSDPAKQWN